MVVHVWCPAIAPNCRLEGIVAVSRSWCPNEESGRKLALGEQSNLCVATVSSSLYYTFIKDGGGAGFGEIPLSKSPVDKLYFS